MPKPTNGHDVQQAMLEALHLLHADNVGLKLEVVDMKKGIFDLKGQVQDLVEGVADLGREVKQLNNRFDHFLVSAGDRVNRLDARVEKLELQTRH